MLASKIRFPDNVKIRLLIGGQRAAMEGMEFVVEAVDVKSWAIGRNCMSELSSNIDHHLSSFMSCTNSSVELRFM